AHATFATPEVPHVANIKSQIKRNRQNEKARQRNKTVRSELQTRTKKVLTAAQNGEETAESLKAAIRRIDTAATKGVLHKNTAARKKSRLIKQVRRLESAEQA
ncbi:MAG TPA: 30S ribosomal protein S20, partial [Acidimicrobiales bacterium]|nr:30S ribosomal protein S20 [Acidimicrobiales bacterium]